MDVLTELVRKKGPTIFFLMETKLSIAKIQKLCFDLSFQSMQVVSSDGRSGGLAMFWKSNCNLHIQTFSPNHMDAHILPANQQPWRITSFYGRPEGHCKHELCQLLRHLHAKSSLPWVCMGDFNEVLHSSEKHGGLPKQLTPMLAFKEMLLHCELMDLGFHGYLFTWQNG